MKDSFALCYIHGSIHPRFMDSVIFFIQEAYRRGKDSGFVTISKQANMYPAQGRNVVTKQFHQGYPISPTQRELPEWMWWVDSDMTFAPDTVWKLIESANKVGAKIMSALYFGYIGQRQGYPGSNLFPVWVGRPEDTTEQTMTRRQVGTNPIEIGGVGMGCCIVHRDVINALYEKHKDDPRGWIWFAYDPGMENGQPSAKGEDVSLCHRAAELGFKIYGDPTVIAGHMKEREENLETYHEAEAKRAARGNPYRIITKPGDPEFQALAQQVKP